MSQAKLTLRPPPNVEFVLGYPGIPSSGADRPQAAVKGTLELRVGPQGIKAKWVRIELRKVETLPGGGQLNTYYDFVGQSPVNLWQSSDDYGLLHTQDFPFYIRIPESIPPSLALERGAGVRYELVAMACLKGKKGFFRRTKAVTITTMSPIVIDKHELHSTWPIYCQPEIRNVTQDGVILTVERSNTCYGPGDRVSVFATVKSDTLHTVILRGFEFVLREHVVFRAGPQATGKKVAPQAKVSIVGEQKVPVNATLYGGTQHRAELACTIPQNHTSATLNSARHIDITYRLSIKAVMGTGSPLIMDLLVIVSNWPRNVSAEAIRRIGPAPTLSLGAQNHPSTAHAQARTIMSQTSAWTVGERNAQRPDHTRPYSTAPVNGYGPQNGNADEFGVVQTGGMNGLASVGSRDSGRPGTGHSATGVSQPDLSTNGRRPRSGSSMNGNNRFTIMNANEQDLQEIKAASSYSRVPNAASSANAWQSAEQEKQHLYDNAKTQVELAQRGHSPPSSQSTHTRMKYQDAGPILQADVMPPRGAASPWEAAEEEKVRLYTQAQMNAMKHQGYEAYSPPSTANAVPASPRHGHSASFNSLNGSATAHTMSPGAALYLQAMSQLNRPILSQPNSNANGSGASGSARNSPPVHAPIPKYYSADQEKEMLRRYDEAKAAVERRQAVEMANEGHEVPPYDLSRSSSTAFPQAMSPPMQVNDLPPALDGGESMPHLLEKERLRRHYEAQDAAAASGSSSAPEVPAYSPPVGGPSQSGASSSTNALSEKELLRRRYEAQDAAAFAGAVPPQPPPRSNSVSNSFQQPRSPPPLPPSYGSANRPLTAAEEKALLRAQYEAEDRGAGSSVAGLSASPPSFPTPDYDVPPPPPLAPRPPVEYIQETQQEDARLQAEIISITPSAPISRATSVAVAAPSSPPPVPENNFGLDFRPFSPFHLPFSSIEEMNAHSSSPPPPLPPKVPL